MFVASKALCGDHYEYHAVSIAAFFCVITTEVTGSNALAKWGRKKWTGSDFELLITQTRSNRLRICWLR
jgi:hypothetical protein